MSLSGSQLAESIASDVLQLIILPTEACNFRCVYCYETFEHGRMKPDVVRAVKKLLSFRVPELSALTISWFGGEPLLAQDIIEDISGHAAALVEKHNKVRYISDITTNAYFLAPELFRRLCGLGVRHYQVSFDGPRELHDKKRILAGGGGTFDRIWSNLQGVKAQEGQFTVYVRLHLNSENHSRIFEFVEKYEADFKDDARFCLFFRPLSRLGGGNDKNLPILSDADAARITGELRAYMEKKGIRYRVVGDDARLCYAAKLNSFVIRSSGIINKCTVALSNELNRVGRINGDGSLTINRENFLRWGRGLESGLGAELSCPLQNIGLGAPNLAIPGK